MEPSLQLMHSTALFKIQAVTSKNNVCKNGLISLNLIVCFEVIIS